MLACWLLSISIHHPSPSSIPTLHQKIASNPPLPTSSFTSSFTSSPPPSLRLQPPLVPLPPPGCTSDYHLSSRRLVLPAILISSPETLRAAFLEARGPQGLARRGQSVKSQFGAVSCLTDPSRPNLQAVVPKYLTHTSSRDPLPPRLCSSLPTNPSPPFPPIYCIDSSVRMCILQRSEGKKSLSEHI